MPEKSPVHSEHNGGGDNVLLHQSGRLPPSVDLSALSEADRVLATECGYKPVFRREFSSLATFSFAVSIGGVFSSIATTFVYPLQSGGSASVVWCWLISGLGCMSLALSVSELVSAYPTSGGMWYTISRLAPERYVPIISWVDGWLNILGQLAGLAGAEWGAAALLLAAVSIGSDFAYQPTIPHTVGTMVAMVVTTGLANSMSTYWIEKMTRSYVVFHSLVLVACAVALLAMSTPQNGTPKHSAEYVFTNVTNQSGWSPTGWSFMFGFLSVSWTMSGYDDTAHIIEEMQNPAIKAPWAISLGMLFTYVAGWLFNIVLCFVMGDITGDDSILNSRIQQPVAQIFFNVLGKGGGVFFTVCALLVLQAGNFTAMQSLTRTIYAFSRDGLLPWSAWWTRVLPRTGIPLLAVWMAVLVCIAINLVGLGSYTAISGVFNVCAIALDWSYCVPIFCKVAFGKFVPGPWNLGRWSTLVNVYACVWTMFVSIIFLMPTVLPVMAGTMNYAVVYLVAILFFSMLYWQIRGKRHYTGPPLESSVEKSVAVLNRDASQSSGRDLNV